LAANNASTITRPAYKDREITVKLTNPEAVQVLRGLHPVELRKRINQYIKNSPESITAVSQLKSGDITIYTRTSTEAKILQKFPGWIIHLGSGAGLYQRKYSVIVYGVQVSKLGLTDTNNKIMTEGIQQKNHLIIESIQI
jgi:hypothetical protein